MLAVEAVRYIHQALLVLVAVVEAGMVMLLRQPQESPIQAVVAVEGVATKLEVVLLAVLES
jgi:hypothetical protein